MHAPIGISSGKLNPDAMRRAGITKRNSKLPPGTEVMSTPGGRVVVEPKEIRNYGGATLSKVSLAKLVRHPDNRHPTQAAIDKMAESIEKNGQLDPIVVRAMGGEWQIISGETRVLARRKLYGAKGECEAHVIHCDDARALELLAIYNADRTDLNAIEKAQMIKRLCDPIAENGSNMSREAAGKLYGLESGSAASNLVRLLELPKVWQDRIALGEFPQTFARLLVPYAHAPRIMEALNKEYLHDLNDKRGDPEDWEGRERTEDTIEQIVKKFTRPIDKKSEHHYWHESFKGKKDTWNYTGSYPALFNVDEVIDQLDVVELGEGKEKRRVATNVEAYDKLQIPAIVKRVDAKSKSKAERSGRDDKPQVKKKLTPAQQKAQAKLKAEQLERRIEKWRHDWIHSLVVQHMTGGRRSVAITDLASQWFVLWYAGNANDEISDFERNQIDANVIYERNMEPGADLKASMRSFARQLIGECIVKDAVAIPLETIEHLALMLEVDLKACWPDLGQEALENFLLLHQSAQLDAIAKEWNVYLKDGLGRTDRIKLLIASKNSIDMPKCIKPLAIAGGKKKRK